MPPQSPPMVLILPTQSPETISIFLRAAEDEEIASA